MRVFEPRVRLTALPVSQSTLRVFKRSDEYDLVVFTSNQAKQFYLEALKKHKITRPHHSKIFSVGPRHNLLKLSLKNKKILFPRSAVAPFDIIKKMRAKGAIVRPIMLYTVRDVPLAHAERKKIVAGYYTHISLRSPSSARGFLAHFSKQERTKILTLPVLSIGPSTTKAAKSLGFANVSSRGILHP